MSKYRLAQINFARIRAPLSEPGMAGFLRQLHSINALAEAAQGFIWRLDETSAGAAGDRAFPRHPPGTTLVNLSVWKSVGALRRFVNFGRNEAFEKRRHTWFSRFDGAWVVLWWVPDGYFPEVEEGMRRLEHLRRHKDTPYAFSFHAPYAPPVGEQDHQPLSDEEVQARITAARDKSGQIGANWQVDW